MEKVDDNYQGIAWKITGENEHSILIVEHETGLEILYVVGAMASVADLIWKVGSVWNRNRFRHFPDPDFDGYEIERRAFDRHGHFAEEHVVSFESILLVQLLDSYKSLNERVLAIENDILKLKGK